MIRVLRGHMPTWSEISSQGDAYCNQLCAGSLHRDSIKALNNKLVCTAKRARTHIRLQKMPPVAQLVLQAAGCTSNQLLKSRSLILTLCEPGFYAKMVSNI